MSADVRLSTAIMTHPARAGQARRLAEQLAELTPVLVVDDSEPGTGNVANALRAWAAVGDDATHHLVLQDDVLPCVDLAARVRDAVSARPDAAISLFCEWGSRSANLARSAARRGWGWARAVDMYTPTPGLVMPRDVALGFAALDLQDGADDMALVGHLRTTGVENLVTVPNLLEHDDEPSLAGNGFQGLRHAVCTPVAGARPDFGTPAAGEGLTRVPYASWMRAHAEWFYCGAQSDEYTWLGDFADVRLPEGLQKGALVELFRADLTGAEPSSAAPSLVELVNELTLFEFWTVYFALGLAEPGPLPPEPGTYTDAAFATALPGLFRRYLPTAALQALQATAGDLARRAFERGAAVDLPRPHTPWFVEPTA